MVDHQSKEVVDRMSDELKIQPAGLLPRNVVNSIQPVFNVNPLFYTDFVATGTRTVTGNLSLVTTHPTKRTFLTAMGIQAHVNSTADNTTITLSAFFKGHSAKTTMVLLSKLSLTAFSKVKVVYFNPPIELQPGSLIDSTTTFSVGACTWSVSAWGYTTDPQ